jgi:hypothetical protein
MKTLLELGSGRNMTVRAAYSSKEEGDLILTMRSGDSFLSVPLSLEHAYDLQSMILAAAMETDRAGLK